MDEAEGHFLAGDPVPFRDRPAGRSEARAERREFGDSSAGGGAWFSPVALIRRLASSRSASKREAFRRIGAARGCEPD